MDQELKTCTKNIPEFEFRELVNMLKEKRETTNCTLYSITEMVKKKWKIANFLTF